jgi:hypothetical protein
MPTWVDTLKELLNKGCRENESNTPDFILAEFMMACLEAFEEGIKARDKWYGIAPKPGKPAPEVGP